MDRKNVYHIKFFLIFIILIFKQSYLCTSKNEKSSTNNVNLFFLASIKNGSAKKDLYSFLIAKQL